MRNASAPLLRSVNVRSTGVPWRTVPKLSSAAPSDARAAAGPRASNSAMAERNLFIGKNAPGSVGSPGTRSGRLLRRIEAQLCQTQTAVFEVPEVVVEVRVEDVHRLERA